MIKRNLLKLVSKFKELSPTVQGFVILALLLIIGILIRWNYIIREVSRGFKFFS